MLDFETVIGLEIHAQLLTRSKIFCGCSPVFGGEPNSHGCPVCLGLPGALPVLNRRVVEMATMTGHALGCTINQASIFARKNYFYPDLPKGYQISQYDLPLCERGSVTVEVDGKPTTIRITRVHLEEDAGKLIHDQDADTLFDVNRCGTPLMEIVTEPDMRSGAEAHAFLAALKQILEYLGVCDCNMEEGSLRCDANISIRPRGQQKLGTKTELKNMNTFRGVERALAYEASRQRDVLDTGGFIEQQTYLWDEKTGRTHPMRSKEDAQDYRYFPDPDLVPLTLEPSWIEGVKAAIPELPAARNDRFVKILGLSAEHAGVLTDTRGVADYFEAVVACGIETKSAATWVMGEVLRIAKEKKCDVGALKLTPRRLADILGLVAAGTISAAGGKSVVDEVESADKEPAAIVDEKGLRQVSDAGVLEQAVNRVIADCPKEFERLKAGDAKLTGFFVGQVMKATKGKGNPKEINRILASRLS